MECPHAVVRSPKSIRCMAATEVLGWNHSVDPSICVRCAAAEDGCSADCEAVSRMIDGLLYTRVAQLWHWDDVPERRQVLRDDTEGSLRLLLSRVGEKRASEALVEAVWLGMPQERAVAISDNVFPEENHAAGPGDTL